MPWTAPSGNHTKALTHYESNILYNHMVDGPLPALEAHFQDGPIQEYGTNGTTNEEVIEMLLDRLTSLNQPPFNCRENSLAITHLEEALMWLKRRTEKRVERGVEGTNVP